MTEGKFIRFETMIPVSVSRKTGRWFVTSKREGDHLGVIEWYGPWRKYIFAPEPFTVFEQVCLRDIAAFVEARTQEHREAA